MICSSHVRGQHPAPPKVQNAAIGDPAPLAELDLNHFEDALDQKEAAEAVVQACLCAAVHA